MFRTAAKSISITPFAEVVEWYITSMVHSIQLYQKKAENYTIEQFKTKQYKKNDRIRLSKLVNLCQNYILQYIHIQSDVV